jgi:DNA replication and repair protein RecF
MILTGINLLNFKNYTEASLEFDAGANIFTGLNGQGKTNIIDAVHYLSNCRSYFNPIDSQNIRHGEDFFVIEGQFVNGEGADKIYCGVKRGNKKIFRRNKEEYEKLAEHVGRFPAVVISPYDKDLISEGSEVRRKFMDSIISQYNRTYLDNLIDYNRVLKQRNMLLRYFWENRTFDADNLSIWSAQLVSIAEALFAERQKFVELFTPVFSKHYAAISGNAEHAEIVYRSDLEEGDFARALNQLTDKDRRTSYSNVGAHKDDLKFRIDGYPLKKFGSQGQQKTFLIALKLAQFDVIRSITGKLPLLLLDDIFDKIDDVRVKHLMKLVSEGNFGQLFITDTHAERLPVIFKEISGSVRVFEVNKGEVYESQPERRTAEPSH